MEKQRADPNIEAIKIVTKKTKYWPALRCNPVKKYTSKVKIMDDIIRIGKTSHISLATKNVTVR